VTEPAFLEFDSGACCALPKEVVEHYSKGLLEAIHKGVEPSALSFLVRGPNTKEANFRDSFKEGGKP
jgi:hypothetical protein